MSKETFRPQSKNLSIQAHPNLKEEIRRRAYEIYEERGREDGHDLEDWICAETEVTSGTRRALSA